MCLLLTQLLELASKVEQQVLPCMVHLAFDQVLGDGRAHSVACLRMPQFGEQVVLEN